ncbi:MAG: class I SAM-dependent methyltransferase [Eubacterium sp.]|nr:class I SAM-dependent methyltransferase [Eubacterium sp.]
MTDQELSIQTEEIQTDGKDTYHCHRYEPTPYAVLDELFSFFTPSSRDVLVDYGCGLGRLNFYVEKLYSLRSTGVEFSPIYYERAIDNLKTYNGKKDNIHFVHCRAEDYIVSSDETLFYFFNPFSAEIFRSVVNRILDSWQEFPRSITLILYYPEDDSIFYLEQHTAFERFDEIAASEAIQTDRRERFSLYRLEN